MCRHAAYLGPAISLQQFLLDPPHSLYSQSWNAQELKYARLNADGYGFGWFTGAGVPSVYTSEKPVWADHNLPALAHSLKNTLWVGEVRSASIGNPIHAFNTQPFCDERWLFVHNGYIRKFHEQVRPALAASLSAEIVADIRGNTDSEYLFATLRQLLKDDPAQSVVDAMRRLFTRVGELVGSEEALLNLVLTDGSTVYASRHAINHESPTLYYTDSDPLFPDSQLVASEAFSTKGNWLAVPEQHFIILRADQPPDLQAL